MRDKRKFFKNYMVMFIFPKGVASSSLDPRGVGAVDMRHNVVIGVVQSSIAQSLQKNHFVMVVLLFLKRIHGFSSLPVQPRIYSASISFSLPFQFFFITFITNHSYWNNFSPWYPSSSCTLSTFLLALSGLPCLRSLLLTEPRASMHLLWVSCM